MTNAQIARFWSRVDIQRPNECWLWQGGRMTSGYGHVKCDGRNIGAHRLAWQLANGRAVPRGLYICHSCDNPLCCNPSHLWLGTASDNNCDATAKKRGPNQPGEANGNARLTNAQVREIKRRLQSGERIVDIVSTTGLPRTTVSAIKNGHRWVLAAI